MQRRLVCFIGSLLVCGGLLLGVGTVASAQELTFTVNSTDDANDGFCTTTHCSLREAIERANNRPGTDTITFGITGTIKPTSALPAITDTTTIDALPNCSGAHQIVIDGSQAGDADGIRIASTSGSIVRGLVISNFASPGRAGVSFERGSTDDRLPYNKVECSLIGTDPAGASPQPNHYGVRSSAAQNAVVQSVVSGNNADGIVLDSGADANSIAGSFIGTNAAGTAPLPNGANGVHDLGVRTRSSSVVGSVVSANRDNGIQAGANLSISFCRVGTDASGATDLANGQSGVEVTGGASINDSVISGQSVAGVWVKSTGVAFITQNQIGTNADGNAALPNGVGVLLNGRGSSLRSNLISGNRRGVELRGDPFAIRGAEANELRANLIGTDWSGSAPLPNTTEGVLVAGFHTRIQFGNVIAFNGGGGVVVPSGNYFGNLISGNRIFSNGALGIDLAPTGPTPNDPDDSDTGANDLQNFPVLTKAEVGDGRTTFEGTLQSHPNSSYDIELFQSPECDPSGFGEGRQMIDRVTVTTDSAGSARFSRSVSSELAAGLQITATATPGSSSPPSTSEFSRCLAVRSRPPDCSTVQASPNPLPTGHGELALVTLSGAIDPDGDEVTLTVTSVTQDEPLLSAGDHTTPDAVAAGPGTVRLRRERSRSRDGRVYRVSFVGSDGRGGECTGMVKVEVRRKANVPAVDSAPPSYDSFGG